MAQQLKTDRTYTTEQGSVFTGPAMYAVITKAVFDFTNDVVGVTMELHDDQACYEAGNSAYAKVSKKCTIAEFATYFSTVQAACINYWDNEETSVDAQSWIKDDWETIV